EKNEGTRQPEEAFRARGDRRPGERGLGDLDGSIAWAIQTLSDQAMPSEEIGAILSTSEPWVVRRYLELHRKRLEDGLADQRLMLALLEPLLTARSHAAGRRSAADESARPAPSRCGEARRVERSPGPSLERFQLYQPLATGGLTSRYLRIGFNTCVQSARNGLHRTSRGAPGSVTPRSSSSRSTDSRAQRSGTSPKPPACRPVWCSITSVPRKGSDAPAMRPSSTSCAANWLARATEGSATPPSSPRCTRARPCSSGTSLAPWPTALQREPSYSTRWPPT